MQNNGFIKFLDQLIFRIFDNSVLPVASQLAYFLILSIFPFLMVFLNILSKTSLVQKDILLNAIYYLPIESQEIITNFVKETISGSSQSLLSISIILGIWSSSSGIRSVIRGINNAYGEKENRSFFILTIMSVVFTIAILILLTLIFPTIIFGEVISNKLFDLLGGANILNIVWEKLRLIIPILYMFLIFLLLYRFSPSPKNNINLKKSLPGAIFSTLGWIIISKLFSYYVNNFGNFNVTYGSLVGIILLLIWLYISSIIILIGGEINASLKDLYDREFEINPNKSLYYKISNLKQEKDS